MWEDDVRMPPPGYRSAPQRRAAEARRMILAVGGVGASFDCCASEDISWQRGHAPSESVPVIQAPSGSVKVKPDNPGGHAGEHADERTLLGRMTVRAAGANLAAEPPEVPDPAALAAVGQSGADACANRCIGAIAACGAPTERTVPGDR